MQYGVVFPQTEISDDPIAIRDYAQAAEDLSYDYLLAYDHVLGGHPNRPGAVQGPYTHRHPFHEVFVLFGYLAGLTKRMGLTTGILILPQRQTALVAKQAAQVDLLSGGRLRLGVGIGWNNIEYEALGMDFHNRGKRIEEQVRLLRQLWTQPLVTFEGRYHTVIQAGINPLPVQRPIPIWFGGRANAVLRRMARLGDGWMLAGRAPDDEAKAALETLRGYLRDAGRDPNDFGIDVWLPTAGQTPDSWARWAEAWRQLGATHLGINTMGAGLKTPQEHIDAIRRFREALG